LGGLEIELLGALLADALERAAVDRADLLRLGQVVDDLEARQFPREWPATCFVRVWAGIVIEGGADSAARASASASLNSHAWPGARSSCADFSEERRKSCAFSQRFSSSSSLMRASRVASRAMMPSLRWRSRHSISRAKVYDITHRFAHESAEKCSTSCALIRHTS
jgi:hypothetical protein